MRSHNIRGSGDENVLIIRPEGDRGRNVGAMMIHFLRHGSYSYTRYCTPHRVLRKPAYENEDPVKQKTVEIINTS